MGRTYYTYYVTESHRKVILFYGSKKNAFEIANVYAKCANEISKITKDMITKISIISSDGESERTEYAIYF